MLPISGSIFFLSTSNLPNPPQLKNPLHRVFFTYIIPFQLKIYDFRGLIQIFRHIKWDYTYKDCGVNT